MGLYPELYSYENQITEDLIPSIEDDDKPEYSPPKPPPVEEYTKKTSMTLAWQDLSVYVPVKDTSLFGIGSRERHHKPFKRLLHNVSGIVHPGTLVAIMGSSGAGKTSLLNVLGYRAKSDVAITGHILVNGIETGGFMSKISGYVYQEDLFFGSLTVSEHLHFMAKMKMDRRLQNYERKRRVEELLLELNLKKVENSRIGIPGCGNGISGGERKRLAFATEILTDPSLLFCDEPTTGLDSFSAQRLVGIMREMSRKGKTIICSIHQPSSQLFSMFDSLILLAEGRIAYFGTTEGSLEYFRSLNYPCPKHYNPADFIIRKVSNQPGEEYESKIKIHSICNFFLVSQIAKNIEEDIGKEFKKNQNLSSYSSDFDFEVAFGLTHIRHPFWISKTYNLVKRALKDSYRNPEVHLFRTVQKILLGILVGVCFSGLILNQEGIQGVEGVVFVILNENTFPAFYSVLNLFPLEFPLFLRETQGGLYSVNSYYFAKATSLIPGFLLEPTIFTALAYWIVGLRPIIQAFLLTIALSVINANTSAAFGCLMSALSDNVSEANSLLSPIAFVFMILGGFYINLGSLGPWVSWTQYTSLFRYSNEAYNIIQWKDIQNINCSSVITEPCIRSGNELLEVYNFDPNGIIFDIIGLISLFIIFHLLAYLALLRKSKNN